jgi:imidazolonepropionase-like amidohydrolase
MHRARTPLYLFALFCLLLALAWPWQLGSQTAQTNATVFEGARLITGDGSAPIENSAFIISGNVFTQVGRRGELRIPAGAAHVDLTGKTVMPALIDLHGHIGFQNVIEGTMSKAFYTRENLIDHLERLAYNGVGATVSIGDLEDRSDMHGGRTHWGDVPLQVRKEVIPNAALFRTAGTGIAWPGSGPQGDPSRVDVSYPVSTVEEARKAVDDYVKMKPEFIKIWVDDRGGTKKTLTPPLYRAIAEEAHKYNVPVAVHNVTLMNAKELMRAGVEGWLHVPVRGGEAVDDELTGIVKQRIARNDRPKIWMTPALITAWMDTQGGTRPAWLDDPLLRDTYSSDQIEEYWGRPLAKRTPEETERSRKDFELQASNAMKLRAAGMRIVSGTDTGQTRFLIGYFNQLDLESMVALGLTPSEAIAAATRDSAEIAKVNAGLVAAGKSADFIILDANPLEKIGNSRRINQVYLRGQKVDRVALKAKWLAERSRKTSSSLK